MLKKYLIPHPENEYKPHVFREASVIGLLVLILGSFIVFSGIIPSLERSSLTAEIYSSAIISTTNHDRASVNNLPALTLNPLLVAAAQAKANDMAAKGYFAHNSPQGLTPWSWIKGAGYNYLYAGENLAVDFTDSDQVVNAWMNSPGHRANILNGHFTEIGVATASGVLDGKPTIFVVQMFGSPKAIALSPPPSPSSSSTLALKTTATSTPTPPRPAINSKVTATSPKQVLGESVGQSNPTTEDQVIAENNNFVAVQNVEGGKEPPAPNWIQKALVNPSRDLTIIYLIISAFIIISLIIFVVVERHVQHPKNISYAILLLLIIMGLLSLHWILFSQQVLIV